MDNKVIKILLSCILFTSFSSWAEDQVKIDPQQDEIHPAILFFIFEGLLGVNAWMASESPHIYGGVGALLFPLVAGGEGNPTNAQIWTGIIGGESIAIYNLTINENKKSKSHIFKNNMIACHLFAGALGITGYLSGDADSDESLSVRPMQHGGTQLVYNYRF